MPRPKGAFVNQSASLFHHRLGWGFDDGKKLSADHVIPLALDCNEVSLLGWTIGQADGQPSCDTLREDAG